MRKKYCSGTFFTVEKVPYYLCQKNSTIIRKVEMEGGELCPSCNCPIRDTRSLGFLTAQMLGLDKDNNPILVVHLDGEEVKLPATHISDRCSALNRHLHKNDEPRMKPEDQFYYELERLVSNFYEETGMATENIEITWSKNKDTQQAFQIEDNNYRPTISNVTFE